MTEQDDVRELIEAIKADREVAERQDIPMAEMDIVRGTVDPVDMLTGASKVVGWMAANCSGEAYVSLIGMKRYPKVEWWTTLGLAFRMFPIEVGPSKKFKTETGYGYEAMVEIRRAGQVVTAASAICTTDERAWGTRDEYAVKSMAATRATAKAFRLGFAGLAVAAGLEGTPSEEIPPGGFEEQDSGHGICSIHRKPFRLSEKQAAAGFAPSHHVDEDDSWCEMQFAEKDRAKEALERIFPGNKPAQSQWMMDNFSEAWKQGWKSWGEGQWKDVADRADNESEGT